MSAEKAKQYAWEAQKASVHPEDRIENIARALFEIAAAIELLDRKIDEKH
jgi:hypothetical protein